MHPQQQPATRASQPLDKNVSPNWKPVPSLANAPSRMGWSDRLWYWLVALGGLALVGLGLLLLVHPMYSDANGQIFIPRKWTIMLMAFGVAIFIFSGPGQAARHGYRST